MVVEFFIYLYNYTLYFLNKWIFLIFSGTLLNGARTKIHGDKIYTKKMMERNQNNLGQCLRKLSYSSQTGNFTLNEYGNHYLLQYTIWILLLIILRKIGKKTIIFLYNIDDTTNVWSLNHHECPNCPWYPFKGIPDLFDLSRSVILIRCVMLLISTLVNLERFFLKLSKCIWNRIGLYHCMLLVELRVFNAIWIHF